MIALSPINDPGRYVVAGMPYPDLRPAGHDFQGKDVMRRFLPAQRISAHEVDQLSRNPARVRAAT